MIEIPLYSSKCPGQVALVDDEDYDLVSPYKWRISKLGYPVCHINGRETTMHRYLLNLEVGNPLQGDHKNHDKLDNRRSVNLRVATSEQNGANKRNCFKTTKSASKYKGVSKSRKKWRARAHRYNKEVRLGVYVNEIDAAKAYDKYMHDIHEEFANLNFPID